MTGATMFWVVLVATSIVLLSAKALLARVCSQPSQNQQAFTLFYGFFACISALILSLLATGQLLRPSAFIFASIGLLLLNTGIYFIPDRAIWTASKLGEVSTPSVIISLTGLISLAFSLLLCREKITLIKLLGAFLIVAAVVIISGDFRT